MSDFLFAHPSFLSGMARSVDIGAAMNGWSYNISQTPQEADQRATANDWKAIGRDLHRAMEQAADEK
jgi:hypothetical protein